LVVRGFAGYFLAQEAIHEPFEVGGLAVSPVQQLAAFIVVGIVVSLMGVKLASDVGTETLEDVIDADRERRTGSEGGSFLSPAVARATAPLLSVAVA